jgi:hypothetical protein
LCKKTVKLKFILFVSIDLGENMQRIYVSMPRYPTCTGQGSKVKRWFLKLAYMSKDICVL